MTRCRASGNNKRKKNNSAEETISIIHGSMEVNGFVRARAFIQFSDIRLKTNIEDVTDALAVMMKLNGKRYHWKNSDGSSDGKVNISRLLT